jgi:hypothetical protein
MVAEICRDPHPKPEAARPQAKAGQKTAAQTAAQTAPGCDTILHLTVKPGANTADDRLPDILNADPVNPIGYRIRMLNPEGHSAGFSSAAFVPSGSAPPPITALRATATREGARIEWQPLDPPALIELDRTLVSAPAKKSSPKKGSVSLPDDQPVEVRLRTAKEETPRNDPGGTLDRSAVRGQNYVYRAQRIRIVELSGHRFELRGAVSPAVTLVMADTFPPMAPTGLATIPGTQGNKPTIDLSWQPNTETDVAGYNVYRREGSSAELRRINDKPILGPAFSDPTITPGTIYTYRVTAVDGTGNESPPSAEATETAVAH